MYFMFICIQIEGVANSYQDMIQMHKSYLICLKTSESTAKCYTATVCLGLYKYLYYTAIGCACSIGGINYAEV
jgi:hypothetical protein